MFCTHCGSKIADPNGFCTSCGACNREESANSGASSPNSQKHTTVRPRAASSRGSARVALWLLYLYLVWNVHTLYAVFLLIASLVLVGSLCLAWRKQPPKNSVRKVFLWIPVPVSALLLAASAATMTPYSYPTLNPGDTEFVRVSRWSGCSWSRTGPSDEWTNMECPNYDHTWHSGLLQTAEHAEESDVPSTGVNSPTHIAQARPLTSPVGKEATTSSNPSPVDLQTAEFVITGGFLADQSSWRKMTIGVDATGELYIVNGGISTKWNPETERWAFGDPVAWTNAEELFSEQPAVVKAMCARHVTVSVFDEILTDDNGRIVHAATEPACRLVGQSDTPAQTTVAPASAAVPTPSGRLLDEAGLGDYTIRVALETTESGSDSVLEILKQETRVYADTSQSIAIHDEADPVPVGADVIGAGTPDLVVKEFSGGAHCCTSFEVFELGSSFRKVATIQQGDCDEGTFQRQRGGYVFVGCDPAVTMYGAGTADAAVPKVILSYANGTFHLALNFMKKPPPSKEELNAKAADISANPTWSTQDVPGAFWQYVIDLTYSGNSGSVDPFVSAAWPAQRTDKNQQMQDLVEQLKKSRYWADIQAMNAAQ